MKTALDYFGLTDSPSRMSGIEVRRPGKRVWQSCIQYSCLLTKHISASSQPFYTAACSFFSLFAKNETDLIRCSNLVLMVCSQCNSPLGTSTALLRNPLYSQLGSSCSSLAAPVCHRQESSKHRQTQSSLPTYDTSCKSFNHSHCSTNAHTIPRKHQATVFVHLHSHIVGTQRIQGLG